MDNAWDDTAIAIPGDSDSEDHANRRAYLVVVKGKNVGQAYSVTSPNMVIGRASGADLQLSDEGVSRFHCKLMHEKVGIVVQDLNSRNGTFCNGQRLSFGMRKLSEGDRLQIGTTSVLCFTYNQVDPSTPPLEDTSATYDALTGAHSRRYFMEQLEHEVELALDRRSALSLLLVHIDRFDATLAEYGREVIDQLTMNVADHLRASIQDHDMLSRIAGGEFALMSRSASPGDTFMLAERLRASAVGLTIPVPDEPQIITLSLGVAALHELRISAANDLLVAAGTALHRARSLGGNRVVLCNQELLKDRMYRTQV